MSKLSQSVGVFIYTMMNKDWPILGVTFDVKVLLRAFKAFSRKNHVCIRRVAGADRGRRN